jgi:pyridoxal phosphate enzyme (YggS family)
VSDDAAIASRLGEIRARIAAACARAGRDPAAVTLVGASKLQPVAALAAAYAAGLRHFGENRVQEAERKAPELPGDVVWHLLGPLQTNKAKVAARVFQTVHSVDRLKAAGALAAAAETRRPLAVFLEVNLAGEPTKHGFAPGEVEVAAREIAVFPALRLRGLMAIPPEEETAERMRPWFRALAALRDRLRAALGPAFSGDLSMGMSGDYEVAVEEGATHVRVGTALFGPRPSPPGA